MDCNSSKDSHSKLEESHKKIRIKQEIVEHLDLFHRIALEELVVRGRAEIVA